MTFASKLCDSPRQAVEGLCDGAVLLVGGFGDSGIPFGLLDAVYDNGARDLTVVSINAGSGLTGIARLIDGRRVGKIICSFPRTAGSVAFEAAYEARQIDLELVPMGTLVERLRAGGAGIAAFFTRVGAGTLLAKGKEMRTIGGQEHILETAIVGDFGLVRAARADAFGNLDYAGVARNLNPVVAKAARVAAVEVDELTTDFLVPDRIITPGVYIDRIVQRSAL